jgi:hypothetical protein
MLRDQLAAEGVVLPDEAFLGMHGMDQDVALVEGRTPSIRT